MLFFSCHQDKNEKSVTKINHYDHEPLRVYIIGGQQLVQEQSKQNISLDQRRLLHWNGLLNSL